MADSVGRAAYPQESLQQAVLALAYRQIVAFLVFMLACAMPLSCQQHGAMSLLALDGDTGHLAAHGAQSSSLCTFHEHQPAPGMILAASVGVMPFLFPLQIPIQAVTLPEATSARCESLPVAPPDQPPRIL